MGPVTATQARGAAVAQAALDAFPDGADVAVPASGEDFADVLVMGGPEAISDDVTSPLHIDYQVSRVAG